MASNKNIRGQIDVTSELDSGSEQTYHELKTVESAKDEHKGLLDRNICDAQPRITEPVQGIKDVDQLSKEKTDLKLVGECGTSRRGDGLYIRLTESCILGLQKGDITKWFVDGKTDAIVNSTNVGLLGGGGVDAAIHRAAGEEDLLKACQMLPIRDDNVRCPVGEAVITKGFKLPVANIIHTVGPKYDRSHDPQEGLADAYRRSLDLAVLNNIRYIAFPAISCGVYGYPVAEAAKIALDVVKNSAKSLREVHFVLFEKETWDAWVYEATSLVVAASAPPLPPPQMARALEGGSSRNILRNIGKGLRLFYSILFKDVKNFFKSMRGSQR